MNPASTASAAAAPRSLLIGTRRIPVVLPSRQDPRLRLSAVIIALQILGQAGLGFKVSIAQILVSIAVAAVIETGVTWFRSRMLVWPASALLTGNSVAFILRASGTRHGDWWSLHGVQYFVLAVVLSLLSKYLIRLGGRHVFNPSNVGLLWTLLVIGPGHVFPQYLWWGPLRPPLTLALIVIGLGAVWVLHAVRKTTAATSFFLVFAALVGIFAALGQSFVAIWHAGPVSGSSYWVDICASPEIFIFVFFMMSDPRTSPSSRRGQVAYGAATAAFAGLLLLPQPTEFGVKVSILAALALTCGLRPLVGALAPHFAVARRAAVPNRCTQLRRAVHGAGAGLRKPAVVAVLIITIAAPADTLALAGDHQIIYLEKGLTGTRNPQ